MDNFISWTILEIDYFIIPYYSLFHGFRLHGFFIFHTKARERQFATCKELQKKLSNYKKISTINFNSLKIKLFETKLTVYSA